jgi:uncharacterized membrane protein YraQ (UPF0718 family)
MADGAMTLRQRDGGNTINRLLFFLLIAASAVLFPPLATRQPWQETFATYFISIVLESVPYILIGSLIAALIELFMPASLLPRMTRRLGLLGIPATALIAPLFPACECGVLAVARGLLRKGLPLPHTITYLLAGPVLNPTVLFTTWLAFQDARYPILRAIGALVVSITIGFAMMRLKGASILLPQLADALQRPEGHDHHGHDHHGHEHHGHDHGHDHDCGDPGCAEPQPAMLSLGGALRRQPPADLATVAGVAPPRPRTHGRLVTTLGSLASHVLDHFLEMAAFFLMGVFIAAGMKTWVGADVFASVGGDLLLGPLAMMATAFVLSLCAEADAFVAASFTEFAFPALMSFLVFGPMFDIKLFLMYRVVFRGWFILALATAISVMVFAYVLLLVPLLNSGLVAAGIGRVP